MDERSVEELMAEHEALGAQIAALRDQQHTLGLEINRRHTETQDQAVAAAAWKSMGPGARAAFVGIQAITMGAATAEVQATGEGTVWDRQ